MYTPINKPNKKTLTYLILYWFKWREASFNIWMRVTSIFSACHCFKCLWSWSILNLTYCYDCLQRYARAHTHIHIKFAASLMLYAKTLVSNRIVHISLAGIINTSHLCCSLYGMLCRLSILTLHIRYNYDLYQHTRIFIHVTHISSGLNLPTGLHLRGIRD